MADRPFPPAPFLVLCLIGFSAFFSSYLRIPVLPLHAAALGAGPAQIGMINGAFMMTAGLLSLPSGLLTDRFGRKLPAVAGISAMAVSSLLISLCRLPLQMAASYVLFGAGLAAFAPAMLSLVADVMPAEKRGQAYGWYTTAIYTAMTIGPATGGFLAGTFGLRPVFVVSGFLSFAVAVLALVSLPAGKPCRRSEMHSVLGGMALLVRNRNFMACLIATVGSCIGFGVFLTFLPLSSSRLGLVPAQVGVVFASQALTNVVCRIPIGIVSDRLDRRRVVAAGLMLIAVALLLLGQTTGMWPMVLCAIVLGGGMALTYTAIGALIAELVSPLQRGVAMGMYNSCIYLGMMTGSTLMGIALKSVSFPVGYAAAGMINLTALALFMILQGRGKSESGLQPESVLRRP